MKTSRRKATAASGLIAALAFVAGGAAAQGYPNRTVTFIWPFAAGAPSGEFYRLLAEEAGRQMGQSMVTEFRGGAGLRLGVQAVSKAPPDGYLLSGAVDGVLTVLPMASASFKVEQGRDYTPITIASESFIVLSSHPSLPFRDLKGLIAYAKANPGKLNFGSTGVGGNSHMHMERLMSVTGIVLTHVPYKSAAQAMPDRLSGTVHLFMGGPDVKTMVDAGKLVGLAVSSPRRMAELPSTPTLDESGFPGLGMKPWISVVGPPGLPRDIVMKVNGAFIAALKTPEIRKRAADILFELLGSSPEEFSARIKTDLDAYAPIVQKLGLKLD